MADVTINNLSYGLPSSGAFIPYTDNNTTLKVSPSGLFASRNSTLLLGTTDNPFAGFDGVLNPSLSTYNAILRGGWLINITEKDTWWGDTSARIGVCKADAIGSRPWWFSHNKDGSCAIHQNGIGDRLSISLSGYVTKPYQPIFRVSMTGGGGNQSSFIKVPFNYAMVNVGNHFDLVNDRFNVPIDGYYQFTAGHMNSQNNTGVGIIEIRKNNTRQCYFHNSNVHPMSTSWSIIIQCNKGDYIDMWASNYHFGGAAELGYDYPTLMGYLIG